MFDGLWIVQFAGMEGKGSGVVVLHQNRVFGGDSAYTYTGTFEVTDDALTARIYVENFDPQIGSVLGPVGNFHLLFRLSQKAENVLEGSASLVAASGPGIVAKLTRKTKL